MTITRPATSFPSPTGTTPAAVGRPPGELPAWRLHVLRVGYLVMGAGLALTKWPLLLDHERWQLREGTVTCMLVAMSVLALVGLRHPVRMLPILLFEVGWKLTWLALVAWPLWRAGSLEGATREQAAAILWVVVVIAAIPWGYVLRQYLLGTGDSSRSRPTSPSPRPTAVGPQAGPPSRHQLALMIWVAVFPTLTVLNLGLGAWLEELTPALRTFVLATIAVPVVMYGVMPKLHRLRVLLVTRGRGRS